MDSSTTNQSTDPLQPAIVKASHGHSDPIAGETGNVSLRELVKQIQHLFYYLFAKWHIILFAGLVGGILGYGYAKLVKPKYKAELTFALEDDKPAGLMGGAAGLASQFGFDIGGSGGGAFSGDNLLEFMKSRSMVEKALLTTFKADGKEQTLAERYIELNDFRTQWDEDPKLKSIQFLPGADRTKFSLVQDSVMGVFVKSIVKNNLVVDKKEEKLSIISVRVESSDELFSKYFTESLTQEVASFYIDTKTKKSAENLAILQHQTDSVRRALNSALSGVASSMDVNPNANLSRQILRVPSQRRQVDVQANQAILTELVKNLEISKVSLRKETPLIQIIDKPVLPLEVERFGKAQGILFGGIMAGFLAVLILLALRFYKKLMD